MNTQLQSTGCQIGFPSDYRVCYPAGREEFGNGTSYPPGLEQMDSTIQLRTHTE